MGTEGEFDDEVRWGTATIAYRCGFSGRKSLAITVHPNLSVTVAAPHGVARATIRQRVLKRAAWIERTLRELALYLPAQPPRRYVSGETHRYLGRQYRLRVRAAKTPHIKLARGCLSVACRNPNDHVAVRELVMDWYRAQARRVFAERIKDCHARVRASGRHPPVVDVRQLAKRWGSCTSGGRITLNVELIKAPRDCIDYVIVHELCHLDEHHHRRRFWRLLDRVMPDWRARRELLNQMADI